jgi:rare lipoprotein A
METTMKTFAKGLGVGGTVRLRLGSFESLFRALVLLPLGWSCAGGTPAPSGASYPDYPKATTSETAAVSRETTPDRPTSEKVKTKTAAMPASSSPLRKDYENAKTIRSLRGKATYYGDSLTGNKTANGERYSPELFTAAHKMLRFGTIVRVIRRDNGKSTFVKINDRGPFGPRDRIIDLSKAAARELEMLRAGVVEVTVEIVAEPPKNK